MYVCIYVYTYVYVCVINHNDIYAITDVALTVVVYIVITNIAPLSIYICS